MAILHSEWTPIMWERQRVSDIRMVLVATASHWLRLHRSHCRCWAHGYRLADGQLLFCWPGHRQDICVWPDRRHLCDSPPARPAESERNRSGSSHGVSGPPPVWAKRSKKAAQMDSSSFIGVLFLPRKANCRRWKSLPCITKGSSGRMRVSWSDLNDCASRWCICCLDICNHTCHLTSFVWKFRKRGFQFDEGKDCAWMISFFLFFVCVSHMSENCHHSQPQRGCQQIRDGGTEGISKVVQVVTGAKF